MASDTDGIEDAFDKTSLALRDLAIKKADELREFADSVLIVCTINEGESSSMIHQHRGNDFAIDGSISRVVQMRESYRIERDQKTKAKDEESGE